MLLHMRSNGHALRARSLRTSSGLTNEAWKGLTWTHRNTHAAACIGGEATYHEGTLAAKWFCVTAPSELVLRPGTVGDGQ